MHVFGERGQMDRVDDTALRKAKSYMGVHFAVARGTVLVPTQLMSAIGEKRRGHSQRRPNGVTLATLE
jgi:hypothetical protein